jgi:hypothetical protein
VDREDLSWRQAEREPDRQRIGSGKKAERIGSRREAWGGMKWIIDEDWRGEWAWLSFWERLSGEIARSLGLAWTSHSLRRERRREPLRPLLV